MQGRSKFTEQSKRANLEIAQAALDLIRVNYWFWFYTTVSKSSAVYAMLRAERTHATLTVQLQNYTINNL